MTNEEIDNNALDELDATGRSRRHVGLNYALVCVKTSKQMYIRDHPDAEHDYIDEAMRVLKHLIAEEEERVETFGYNRAIKDKGCENNDNQ